MDANQSSEKPPRIAFYARVNDADGEPDVTSQQGFVQRMREILATERRETHSARIKAGMAAAAKRRTANGE